MSGPEQMRTVQLVGSSCVESVAYNPLTSVCEVKFASNGRTWRYAHVDSSDVLQLLFSGSSGTYMNSVFRKKYIGTEVLSTRSA